MALCSESTGRMTAPVRAQMSRTRPPARTRDSLLARQTTLPARAAARVPASRPRPPGPKARWRLRAGPPVAHSPRALPERAACIRREAGRRVFRRRPRPARPGRAGGGVGPGPPGAPHYGRRPDPTRGRSPVWPPPRPGRCARWSRWRPESPGRAVVPAASARRAAPKYSRSPDRLGPARVLPSECPHQYRRIRCFAASGKKQKNGSARKTMNFVSWQGASPARARDSILGIQTWVALDL